jgi:hypothetical protein
MNIDRSTQLALVLGSFLGQDVALECLATFDGTAWANAKTLLRAALGFHFWHENSALSGQLRYWTMTGGSNFTALGCLSSLIVDGQIEPPVTCFA